MRKSNHRPDKEMFTPEEAAIYMNISISTLYKYLNRNVNPLPSYKFSSKNIRIKKNELSSWMSKASKKNY